MDNNCGANSTTGAFFTQQPLQIIDAGVKVSGSITSSRNHSHNHPLVEQSSLVCNGHCVQNGVVKKTELISIWSDNAVSLPSKMLITLWWGKVGHYNGGRVYSACNLDRLNGIAEPLENDLSEISNCADFNESLRLLEAVFRKFEKGGDYHIDGVGKSFFTKWLYFWFLSHPLASNPDFLPVIADKWMCYAIYAAMCDHEDASRHELFNTGYSSPDLRLRRYSHASSYITFIRYFNSLVDEMRQFQMELTPLVLEDVIFNKSREITPIYFAADQGLFN